MLPMQDESWFTRTQEIVDPLSTGVVVAMLIFAAVGYGGLWASATWGMPWVFYALSAAPVGWALFRLMRAVDGFWPHAGVFVVFVVAAGLVLWEATESLSPLVSLLVVGGVARVTDAINEAVGSVPTSFAVIVGVPLFFVALVWAIANDN